MIKLRLKRYGKKREVSYRIVAMNSASRRDGRALQELGFYNPRTDETRLDVPGIVRWLQQGAQPTDTVRHILQRADVLPKVGKSTKTLTIEPSEIEAPVIEAPTIEAPVTETSEIEASVIETSEIEAPVEVAAV
jgi:small subunit ribosomal protein S16